MSATGGALGGRGATNATVGRRIRQARMVRGLTQADLGRLLARPRSHAAISDIERGKTRLDVAGLAEFARLLGVAPAALLGGDGADRDTAHPTLREQQVANAALTLENTRLRAALAEAEARAARAPAADDYPAEVFRELWRVLGELRAGTGEEGRA